MKNNIRCNSRLFNLTVVWIALVALIAFGSCTKGLTGDQSGRVAGGKLPVISLSALGTTPDEAINRLEVAVARVDQGFEVTVSTGVDSSPLDSLFFRLEFDPEETVAEQISLSRTEENSNVLQLATEVEPGIIDVGFAGTTTNESPAVSPGESLVSFRLVEASAERTTTSAENVVSLSRPRNLELENKTGNWVISWDYSNDGDTNQDGEVGVSDLTPIAIHYGQRIENSWDDPRRHIDGDHNLEINLADITPIGQNYSAQIWAYQIEMSVDGDMEFVTVGQLLLGDSNDHAEETVRFSYKFDAQYVPGAWYRIVGLDRDLQFGPPSEAICETTRRIDPVVVTQNKVVNVTVNVHNLDLPISQMNAVRVQFPAGYEYVPGSANPGSFGGEDDRADGIWSGYTPAILFPPDNMFTPLDAVGDFRTIDFNVTALNSISEAVPVAYGDLFNFQLKNISGQPLTLDFPQYSEDGILRNYYTDINGDQQTFGNRLGFEFR